MTRCASTAAARTWRAFVVVPMPQHQHNAERHHHGFIGLHELFDKIDEAVEAYVDLVAERIVQLGGIAGGTARVAAGRSRLEDYPLTIADGSAHVEAVSKALTGAIKSEVSS